MRCWFKKTMPVPEPVAAVLEAVPESPAIGPEIHAMSDEGLLGYCEAHCRTPRALFHEMHINHLLRLAGDNKFATAEWASYGPEVIDPLVKRARYFLEWEAFHGKKSYREF